MPKRMRGVIKGNMFSLLPGEKYSKEPGVSQSVINIAGVLYKLGKKIAARKNRHQRVKMATKFNQTDPSDKYVVKIRTIEQGNDLGVLDKELSMLLHLGYLASKAVRVTEKVVKVYLVMKNIGDVINEAVFFQGQRSFDPNAKLGLAINFAEALYRLHAQNILHGDFKMDNLLLSKDTLSLLAIDFEFSEHFSDKWFAETNYSGRVVKGRSPHIAPECRDSKHPKINCLSDVFSLGFLFKLFSNEEINSLGQIMQHSIFLDRPHLDLVLIYLLVKQSEDDSKLEDKLESLGLPVKTAAVARKVCECITDPTFRQASNILSQLGHDLYDETNLLILARHRELQHMLIENRKRLEEDAIDLRSLFSDINSYNCADLALQEHTKEYTKKHITQQLVNRINVTLNNNIDFEDIQAAGEEDYGWSDLPEFTPNDLDINKHTFQIGSELYECKLKIRKKELSDLICSRLEDKMGFISSKIYNLQPEDDSTGSDYDVLQFTINLTLQQQSTNELLALTEREVIMPLYDVGRNSASIKMI